MVHHDDMAAGLLDFAQQVGREQDRRAAGADPQQRLADLDDLSWVEAVDRLVQDEQIWLAEERLSVAETLAHPVGVRLHLPVGRRAETRDIQAVLEMRLRHRPAVRAPVKLEVAPARQMRHEPGSLDERPDPREHSNAGPDDLAEDRHGPACRADQAEQGSKRRGLPSSVRAQQTDDLAAAHGEGQVIDGKHAGAKPFGEAGDLDDRRRIHRRSLRPAEQPHRPSAGAVCPVTTPACWLLWRARRYARRDTGPHQRETCR